MDNVQNGGSPRQQATSAFSPSIEDFEDSSKKTGKDSLDKLDGVSISILRLVKHLGKAESKEVRDALHLSRSPVSGRLKQLSESGFLIRTAKPGTEHKLKPTYTYEVLPGLQLDSASTENAESQAPVEETTIEIMAELLSAAIQEIAALKSRISRLEAAINTKPKLDHKALFDKLQS